jgi:hypothetical protein
MRRALREAGLGAQVQQRKPFLSRKHVLACLWFAQRFANWTIDDWKCVIFSDETKINRFDHMVSHDVGLKIKNALDLNMSIRL